jgi:hypothetical protein
MRGQEDKKDEAETETPLEPKKKKPWVKPAIVEEEEFQTFTLACAMTGPCGIAIPRS